VVIQYLYFNNNFIDDFLALNFSHRIDHLSFGLPTPGLIQPLNGDLKLANTSK
jgi:hypothetical protein